MILVLNGNQIIILINHNNEVDNIDLMNFFINVLINSFFFPAPEMEEISELTRQYYSKRDELKALNAKIAEVEQNLNENSSRLTMTNDKYKQLTMRE